MTIEVGHEYRSELFRKPWFRRAVTATTAEDVIRG
jgi:hypothetical protein